MAKKKNKKVLEIPKYIKATAQTLSLFSEQWAAKFALNLFDKPIKFPMPQREKEMDKASHQYTLTLPSTQKEIHVYEAGKGSKKALLIHGWNGRGTQMISIAKQLAKNDFTVISFDAPGHGKAKNSRAIMTDFIEAAHQLDKKYKGFDVVIGHSLGGMSTINAISRGLTTKKGIIVGAGDIIQDIINDFVKQLGLKQNIGMILKDLFEKKYGSKVEDYTVHTQAKSIEIPILVFHDKNDKDVPYTASENIVKHLKNGTFVLTEKLGHRKILGNEDVIKKIVTFSTTE